MEFLPLAPDTPHFRGAVECYAAVHRVDTAACETARERFARHTSHPGWDGLVAVEDGRVVGYAYGHASRPDQPYHRQLRAFLTRRDYERWLTDCFELVELGVREGYRGQGIGSRLHDTLLAGADHATALLTTGVENRRARGFYTRRGWERVAEPFRPEGGQAMVVMGAVLR